ncbi:MAG: glycosyltransferase family 2 protein [Cyanobacteria bacterium P01_H01_bin.119]
MSADSDAAIAFSIITPSYNQGAFIERTIQSILSQTEVILEYVVCDGGSTDKTVDILRRYDSKLRWISEADGGQAAGVNKGLSMTSNDIIGWINSDDVYAPNALKRVQDLFEQFPDVDLIYGDATYLNESDHIIGSYPTQLWDYKKLKLVCYLCQPAVFFRRRLVEQFGPLNETLHYCLDYELWLRYGKMAKVHYLPQILASSRLYQSTKSIGSIVAAHRETNDMLKQTLGYVPDTAILRYARMKTESDLGREISYPVHNRVFNLRDAKLVRQFLATAFESFWRWQKVPSPMRVLNMLIPRLLKWRGKMP